jgi:CRP-like cAMP-binding protein
MTQQAERQAERAAIGGAAGDGQRREKVYYLSKTDLFRDLGQEQLQELERSVAMNTCRRGRVFFSPGETGEVLFILKAGRVNLYRITAEGKKLITGTVEPGSVFGEMSLIGAGMQGSFAEAGEDCLLCAMSRTDVERMLARFPTVALRLLELLARRVEDAEERLADSAYKSTPARIATTLLRLSGEDSAPVRLSHQDIAEMVGTYRETATRILNEMRSASLIDLRRLEIAVRDRAGLEAIAHDAE